MWVLPESWGGLQVEATNRSVAARITAHASPAVQNDNDDSGNRGGSEMAGPNVDLVEGVGERDQREDEVIEEDSFFPVELEENHTS
ncbi:hypothetical protein ETB97_002219 [Aspergillus alliaceus]|uniref:Uncharacterized protein n=1 Tax=Petromyces alliaceus TaxID=209559 RepID=A0A8H6E6E6_PETAA|nr:hypothetical protein ETB97_002219 [Aspergillus burnettii]